MKNTNPTIGAYEACSILNIPLSSLYYLSSTGKIKAIKVGKRWRYNREDIEHYSNFGTRRVEIIRSNRRERRTYPRINCHVPCSFKIDLPDKQNQNGNIQNISASGLLLGVYESVNIRSDDPVILEFTIGCGIKVSGRVVRIQDNSMVVKYRNIPEQIKEEIIRYVG